MLCLKWRAGPQIAQSRMEIAQSGAGWAPDCAISYGDCAIWSGLGPRLHDGMFCLCVLTWQVSDCTIYTSDGMICLRVLASNS